MAPGSNAMGFVRNLFNRFPIAKGMAAYGIMWPTGNIIHQTMDGKRWETYDWDKCRNFSLYGCLFVAPTLYGWVRLTTVIWPVTNLRSAVTKAFIEQLTYGPAATASFFFFMSLLEKKTVEEGKEEVKRKLLPTMKVAACYWFVVQTVNYTLIPERNRVPIVSLFGLVWTTFLAYMKQQDGNKLKGTPTHSTLPSINTVPSSLK